MDRYAMGTLPGHSIPQVEEHLLSCTFCQERLVEADEFLTNFRSAATQLDLRPAPFWKRFQNPQRLVWGGSAVAAAFLVLLISGQPPHMNSQPAMVMMQSLRGPEAKAQIQSGHAGVLVFDVSPLPAHANYEIEVVDASGRSILKGAGSVKEDHLTFPIEKLAPSAYWVRVYRSQPARELIAEYGLQAK